MAIIFHNRKRFTRYRSFLETAVSTTTWLSSPAEQFKSAVKGDKPSSGCDELKKFLFNNSSHLDDSDSDKLPFPTTILE